MDRPGTRRGRPGLSRIQESEEGMATQVVTQMDKHVIMPGSSLSRWRDALAELIKE